MATVFSRLLIRHVQVVYVGRPIHQLLVIIMLLVHDRQSIVELNLDLNSNSNPVRIVRYYSIPQSTGALEATVVTVAGNDYLYVLGTDAHVISGYHLSGSGNAILNGVTVTQQGDTSTIPKLAGITAYVQN